MRRRDFVVVVGGGAGTVWTTATKLLTVSLAAVGQLFWLLLVPLAAITWRVFSGYRRAIRDRSFQRTRSLYFQNLGNNASAIQMLLEMIWQEEVKEALLLDVFVLKAQTGRAKLGDIEKAIEEFIWEHSGRRSDFDTEDALESLRRLRLLVPGPGLRVLSPEQAAEVLNRHWLGRRTANYHVHLAESFVS